MAKLTSNILFSFHCFLRLPMWTISGNSWVLTYLLNMCIYTQWVHSLCKYTYAYKHNAITYLLYTCINICTFFARQMMFLLGHGSGLWVLHLHSHPQFVPCSCMFSGLKIRMHLGPRPSSPGLVLHVADTEQPQTWVSMVGMAEMFHSTWGLCPDSESSGVRSQNILSLPPCHGPGWLLCPFLSPNWLPYSELRVSKLYTQEDMHNLTAVRKPTHSFGLAWVVRTLGAHQDGQR